MLFNSAKSNKYYKILVIVGLATMVFGAIVFKRISVEGLNISMLKGMFQGAGGMVTAIGLVKLIQNKISPEEKLKMKEIELKDERNIELLKIALSFSSTVATILFGILAFLFIAMDYIIPGFIAIGAMYIQMLVFYLAHKYYDKKI